MRLDAKIKLYVTYCAAHYSQQISYMLHNTQYHTDPLKSSLPPLTPYRQHHTIPYHTTPHHTTAHHVSVISARHSMMRALSAPLTLLDRQQDTLTTRHAAGQTTGHAAGQTTGHTAGQTTGHTAGQTTGHTAGQTTGHTAGQTTGHTAGQTAATELRSNRGVALQCCSRQFTIAQCRAIQCSTLSAVLFNTLQCLN
jgi:hypothetical protein